MPRTAARQAMLDKRKQAKKDSKKPPQSGKESTLADYDSVNHICKKQTERGETIFVYDGKFQWNPGVNGRLVDSEIAKTLADNDDLNRILGTNIDPTASNALQQLDELLKISFNHLIKGNWSCYDYVKKKRIAAGELAYLMMVIAGIETCIRNMVACGLFKPGFTEAWTQAVRRKLPVSSIYCMLFEAYQELIQFYIRDYWYDNLLNKDYLHLQMFELIAKATILVRDMLESDFDKGEVKSHYLSLLGDRLLFLEVIKAQNASNKDFEFQTEINNLNELSRCMTDNFENYKLDFELDKAEVLLKFNREKSYQVTMGVQDQLKSYKGKFDYQTHLILTMRTYLQQINYFSPLLELKVKQMRGSGSKLRSKCRDEIRGIMGNLTDIYSKFVKAIAELLKVSHEDTKIYETTKAYVGYIFENMDIMRRYVSDSVLYLATRLEQDIALEKTKNLLIDFDSVVNEMKKKNHDDEWAKRIDVIAEFVQSLHAESEKVREKMLPRKDVSTRRESTQAVVDEKEIDQLLKEIGETGIRQKPKRLISLRAAEGPWQEFENDAERATAPSVEHAETNYEKLIYSRLDDIADRDILQTIVDYKVKIDAIDKISENYKFYIIYLDVMATLLNRAAANGYDARILQAYADKVMECFENIQLLRKYALTWMQDNVVYGYNGEYCSWQELNEHCNFAIEAICNVLKLAYWSDGELQKQLKARILAMIPQDEALVEILRGNGQAQAEHVASGGFEIAQVEQYATKYRIQMVTEAAELMQQLSQEYHFACFVKGGYVVDSLLHKKHKDVDMVINYQRDGLLYLLRRLYAGQAKIVPSRFNENLLHFTSYASNEHFEIACYPGWSAEQMLQQSVVDFNYNALFCDHRGVVYDPHGRGDYVQNVLQHGPLSAVHAQVFQDPRCLLRVFKAKLKFATEIDAQTKTNLREAIAAFSWQALPSLDRGGMLDHFVRGLSSEQGVHYLMFLQKYHLLEKVLPSFANYFQGMKFADYKSRCDSVTSSLTALIRVIQPEYPVRSINAAVLRDLTLAHFLWLMIADDVSLLSVATIPAEKLATYAKCLDDLGGVEPAIDSAWILAKWQEWHAARFCANSATNLSKVGLFAQPSDEQAQPRRSLLSAMAPSFGV